MLLTNPALPRSTGAGCKHANDVILMLHPGLCPITAGVGPAKDTRSRFLQADGERSSPGAPCSCPSQRCLLSQAALLVQLAALRRYRQVFQLGDIPGGAKEDLLPAIQRHFAQQVLLALPAPFPGTWFAEVAHLSSGPCIAACARRSSLHVLRRVPQVHAGCAGGGRGRNPDCICQQGAAAKPAADLPTACSQEAPWCCKATAMTVRCQWPVPLHPPMCFMYEPMWRVVLLDGATEIGGLS